MIKFSQPKLNYSKTIHCNLFFLFPPITEFDQVLLYALNVPLTKKFEPPTYKKMNIVYWKWQTMAQEMTIVKTNEGVGNHMD